MPVQGESGSSLSASSHEVVVESSRTCPEPAFCLRLNKHSTPAVVLALNWTCSSMSASCFLWGAPDWTQDSGCGPTSPTEGGITTVATPLLIQPRKWLAFFSADSCSACCPAQPPYSSLQNCFPPCCCPACTFPWAYSIPSA